MQSMLKQVQSGRVEIYKIVLSSLSLLQSYSCSQERPHKFISYQVLNKVDMLENTDTMPGKWQLLIYLGQKTVAHIQSQQANA